MARRAEREVHTSPARHSTRTCGLFAAAEGAEAAAAINTLHCTAASWHKRRGSSTSKNVERATSGGLIYYDL